ncbi:MAG: hypothetical protein HQ522_04000 [Bacteroidetes bacterium]|nr:hypothetical protein [Bacteroidota bacterium]
MSDKNLKDIWNKTENVMEASSYESETIERFTSSRSSSVSDKVKKMLQLDIGLKLLVAIVLGIDAIFYFKTPTVFAICLIGIVLLISLVLFEFNVIKRFAMISDNGQNTKENLSAMLTFLRSRFFTALLSIASTYIFIFISGTLMYFYATYGEVRPLDGLDIVVFSGFIIIGIVINFVANYSQVKYYIKHLELCLSDLNDNVLAIVTSNIEAQQKQDRTTKLLVGLVLVLGFVLLIVIFKSVSV